jgi:hypothetical protein
MRSACTVIHLPAVNRAPDNADLDRDRLRLQQLQAWQDKRHAYAGALDLLIADKQQEIDNLTARLAGSEVTA